MKQSGHLYLSEETGTGFPVTSKYGRTSPNKHGGVGRQQQQQHVLHALSDNLLMYYECLIRMCVEQSCYFLIVS